MTPVGRPPLARAIYSIEDLRLDVPTEVLLDTSFVVDALIDSQPSHEICANFLLQLVEAETVLYFSRLLDLELAEAAFRIALRERYSSYKTAREDGRARRRAGRLMEEARAAWGEALSAFGYLRVEIHEVADQAPALMTAHGLGSYDAVHAATADHLGLDAIVTLDSGFARLPSRFMLYTTSARLRPFRERRLHSRSS